MAADDRTLLPVYALKQRLEALESEKSELLAELARLQCNQDAVAEARAPSAATGSVNAASDAAAKIKLFRSLFRGRDEVFPRRWQNANSGKPGYSPFAATSGCVGSARSRDAANARIKRSSP
jgi:hypothetical protein